MIWQGLGYVLLLCLCLAAITAVVLASVAYGTAQRALTRAPTIVQLQPATGPTGATGTDMGLGPTTGVAGPTRGGEAGRPGTTEEMASPARYPGDGRRGRGRNEYAHCRRCDGLGYTGILAPAARRL